VGQGERQDFAVNVDNLIVEEGRDDHIARHNVSLDEVDQVVFGRPYWRRVRDGRFILLGQTVGGRYLAVVVAPRGNGNFALVTARDASLEERRWLGAGRRR
jgi:uncharacterized protein